MGQIWSQRAERKGSTNTMKGVKKRTQGKHKGETQGGVSKPQEVALWIVAIGKPWKIGELSTHLEEKGPKNLWGPEISEKLGHAPQSRG